MFYLIYVSSSVKLMDDDELLEIMEVAREENERLGITGMLLYQDGSFMQMLEGEKQTVLDLYDKIKKDKRHKTVLTMISEDIEERNFADWSMGFFNMDRAGDFSDYAEYFKENISLRSFKEDSRDAYDFIRIFNRINR